MQQCPEFWILVASTVEQFSFLSTLSHTKVVQPPVSAMIYESKPTNHIWPWFLMNMAKDDFLPWDGFRSTSLFVAPNPFVSGCISIYTPMIPLDIYSKLFSPINICILGFIPLWILFPLFHFCSKSSYVPSPSYPWFYTHFLTNPGSYPCGTHPYPSL